MNFNSESYIYILYYQSNLLILLPKPTSYPYKMKYFICKAGVGTARKQDTRVHRVVGMRERHHVNVDRQRMLLTDVEVNPPSFSV